MNRSAFRSLLSEKSLQNRLAFLYGQDATDHNYFRYSNALSQFERCFPEDEDIIVISTPGRTEIGGNHTDHNAGLVLAASLDLDMIGIAAINNHNIMRIYSDHHDPVEVETSNLHPNAEERHTSKALLRGVAARMQQLGYRIGGFDCWLTSNIWQGVGISSSAAFEVEMCSILNHLYNEGEIDHITIAKIAQYAENHFFEKPCGLMDQLACAVGGIILIDFENPENPKITKIISNGGSKNNEIDGTWNIFGFEKLDHTLFLIETGTSHTGLTDEYAAVEREMKQVANVLGKSLLRQCSKEQFLGQLFNLREQICDRALLRAYHYFNENERVLAQFNALKAGDMCRFKELVIESGRSSYMYCQNIYPNKEWHTQPLSLAFMLAENILREVGAWRLQGGGFGGMLQAYVPINLVKDFENGMSMLFGDHAMHRVRIRPIGTTRIF
ncbi:MAG: galactokinase [Clostridiaceae bacterium]|jgi:galactokinase|nr:galactokinase [Clostridiaceae bacterium]